MENHENESIDDALDNLQKDLSQIETGWNRIITIDTNPLQLALSFLDNTSVGLGYKYQEFNQLKNQIAHDLQIAVNEHYQAFNSSIASYEQTVEYISESQDSVTQIKDQMNRVLTKLSASSDNLDELNETSIEHTNMIDILTGMEEVISITDKLDNYLDNKDYKNAQILLSRGFTLAKNYRLWDFKVLKDIKQQLELKEYNLFHTIIEDINEIIYSKRKSLFSENNIFKQDTDEGFTNLESYLHHVINIDISEQSNKMSSSLNSFLNNLSSNYVDGHSDQSLTVQAETDYDRIFWLMQTLHDMNKLGTALDSLVNRTKEELHNAVIKSVDDLRVKHPSLVKMITSIRNTSDFGLSGKDILSVLLRKLFWVIFTVFLGSIQAHRVVYEVNNLLNPSSTTSLSYPYDKVWDKTLEEIKLIVTSYINDPNIYKDGKKSHRTSNVTLQGNHILENKSKLFTLQNNFESNDTAKERANELKTLLQNMFPGFTVSATLDPTNIYLEDETFEQETTLVPPTIFNMKVILESFLVFIEGTKNIIPEQFQSTTISSLAFFQDFLKSSLIPRLDRTFVYLFELKVEANNIYALETITENRTILKSAIAFKKLFTKILYLMNASYSFRESIATMILNLLNKFYTYYHNILHGLINSLNSSFNKGLIINWLNDSSLTEITKDILCGKEELIETEINIMMSYCSDFYTHEKNVSKSDFFHLNMVDTIMYFLNTISWINRWLPTLKQQIQIQDNPKELSIIDKLRDNWTFLEILDFDKVEKLGNLKFLLDIEHSKRFDELSQSFISLEYKLLQCLRYDMRVRCTYYISTMFYTSTWNSDVTSIELNQNISTLTSELSILENKLKQRIDDHQCETLFQGLSDLINYVLINGMQSISVLTNYGIKKLIRNVNVLQQFCQNITLLPHMIDLGKTLNYLALYSMNENTIIERFNTGKLNDYSLTQIQTLLRLQFSEDIVRQIKRQGDTAAMSITTNKRYSEAIGKLHVK